MREDSEISWPAGTIAASLMTGTGQSTAKYTDCSN
jgi:hypothetical protein